MIIDDTDYSHFKVSKIKTNTITIQANVFKREHGKVKMKKFADSVQYSNNLIGMEYFDIIGTIRERKNRHNFTKKVKKKDVYIIGYPCSKARRKKFSLNQEGYIPTNGFSNSMFIIININGEKYNVDEYYNRKGIFKEKSIKHVKLFKNGRMQITGCKSSEEIVKAMDILNSELAKYSSCFTKKLRPHYIHSNMYDVIYTLLDSSDKNINLNLMKILKYIKERDRKLIDCEFAVEGEIATEEDKKYIKECAFEKDMVLSENERNITPLKFDYWVSNNPNDNEKNFSEIFDPATNRKLLSREKITVHTNGQIIITGGNTEIKILKGIKIVNKFISDHFNDFVHRHHHHKH